MIEELGQILRNLGCLLLIVFPKLLIKTFGVSMEKSKS